MKNKIFLKFIQKTLEKIFKFKPSNTEKLFDIQSIQLLKPVVHKLFQTAAH